MRWDGKMMDWTSFLQGTPHESFQSLKRNVRASLGYLPFEMFWWFSAWNVPSPKLPNFQKPHDVPVFTRATSMDLYLFKSNLRKTSVGNGAACNTTSPRNPVVATELRVNLAWEKYIGSPEKKTSPGTFFEEWINISSVRRSQPEILYTMIDQVFEEPSSKFFDCRVAPVQCESYTQETANYPPALDFQKRSVF